MQTAGELLNYISTQNHLSSTSLLTLNNYLHHLLPADSPLTVDLLNRFFRDCLVYPHWIQNRKELEDSTKELLRRFETEHRSDLNLSDVKWPTEMQVIEIENRSDFLDLINAYLTFQYQKSGSRFRLISDSDKLVYALILHNDRSLTIRQFDRRMTILNGAIAPLRTDLEVQYRSDLDIEGDVEQKLEISPFVSCRFYKTRSLFSASLVRGYMFQKFHEFKDSRIESYPRLFYTLKKLERHFIRRETDPFYQQLTTELERTLHLIRLREPLDEQLIMNLQVRAQNALEYVYTDDKLLNLLIRELKLGNQNPLPQVTLKTNESSLPMIAPEFVIQPILNNPLAHPAAPSARNLAHLDFIDPSGSSANEHIELL